MTDDMIPHGGAEKPTEPDEQNNADRLSELIDEEAEAIPYFSLSDIERSHEPIGSEGDTFADNDAVGDSIVDPFGDADTIPITDDAGNAAEEDADIGEFDENIAADNANEENITNETDKDEASETNAADNINFAAENENGIPNNGDAQSKPVYETLWQADSIPCSTDDGVSDDTSGTNAETPDSTHDEFDHIVIGGETNDGCDFSIKSQHIAAIVSGNELSIHAHESDDGQPTSGGDADDGSSVNDAGSATDDKNTAFTSPSESLTNIPSRESAKEKAANEAHKQRLEARRRKHAQRRDGRRGVDSLFDTVELCVFTLAAVLVIMAFFFRHAVVDGTSMSTTLEDSDALIISDFLYSPKVGDIVVVEDYEIYGPNNPLVKRIVAVGGQLVRIQANGVYVDGVREEYHSKSETPADFNYILNMEFMTVKYPSSGLDVLCQYEDYEYVPGIYVEFRVPEGDIFVLGDNRDNSTDSRFFGCVDEESIIGRVLLRIYPFSSFGTVD